MEICSIASGSAGNCIYIGSGRTRVLVDAGVSTIRIERGLRAAGCEPEQLTAVLITHEHSDHIKGLGPLLRKYKVPYYATARTLAAIASAPGIGTLPEELARTVVPDTPLAIGELTVTPFSVPHDAADPVSYTVQADGHKIGLVTDLGEYNASIVARLTKSEVLYLEANHDRNMLMAGRYPYSLKQRIAGSRGHLSNEASAALACELLHDGLKLILLGHLSKENNYAELAFETVRYEVEHRAGNGHCPLIRVANRDIPSEPVVLA